MVFIAADNPDEATRFVLQLEQQLKSLSAFLRDAL
jgi:plasmid stabilization system protein ParE